MTAVGKLVPALRERPGDWAALMESANQHACSNVVTAFRRGRFGAATHWEHGVRRNPETGKHVLYVRYVGPKR